MTTATVRTRPANMPTRRALPASAGEYATHADRVPADPIGLRGLPDDRRGLDALVVDLCRLLRGARQAGLTGRSVARALGLTGTRAVRMLASYARVHQARREVLGMPGSGYYWGPLVPDLRVHMIGHSRRMGRCWLFLSALYRRGGVASTVAQLAFDFMGADNGAADELAAMVQAEGTTIGDVLEHLVTRMKRTPQGRAALAETAARHGDVLLPTGIRADLMRAAEQIRNTLAALDAAACEANPETAAPQAPPLAADKTRTNRGQEADTTAD